MKFYEIADVAELLLVPECIFKLQLRVNFVSTCFIDVLHVYPIILFHFRMMI